MKTNTIIEYGAVDVTAKPDSELSTNNSQSFSEIGNLKRPSVQETKYSTLEKNHFVLDGKSENMGNNIDVAWWSQEMSDSQGGFTTPLVLTINFSQSHSGRGLTLTFSKYAYCNSLKIQYYNSSNELISENTFEPDSYDYFCEDLVENYQKIIITFYSTNIPYRYLKLYRILYGRGVLFQGEDLVHANMLEQINLLSDELSINTLDFTVYSNDDQFNILNPEGIYSTLEQGQQMKVYQEKNNQLNDMGTFYVDTWKSENDNKMTFSCVDLIGLLDKTTFDGDLYAEKPVEDLIEEIFTSAGFSSDFYTIQQELRDIEINGYIAPCTCREALQQVLFVIGAVANDSRNDIIEIYRVEEVTTPNQIPKANVFKGSRQIEKGEEITGLSIEVHSYGESQEEEKTTLFYGKLEEGIHKIIFERPAYDITVFTLTGSATIVATTANYAIINVTSASNYPIAVNGYEYVDSTKDILMPNGNANSNAKPNVLRIDSIGLINDENATGIGQRIINYYNKNFSSRFKFVLDDERIGDNIELEESYGNVLNGFITDLDIDLTGGYVADMEVIAKVRASNG